MKSQSEKATLFNSLHHQDDLFIMPNAWDAGSAILLANQGFKAIGTTSAGISFSAGLPDYQVLTREEMLDKVSEIADAVDIPVNADLEAGYGETAAGVEETARLAIERGISGANIEDSTMAPDKPLYEMAEAVERLSAAASGKGTSDFMITARCDTYLNAHPDPFGEAVKRCNAYYEAGADCLFVPGLTDKQAISKLVSEVDGPVNVVMGLSGGILTKDDLSSCGVKRISVGGSIARTALELIRKAGEEMMTKGTFTFANEQYGQNDLCVLFDEWRN